MSVRPLLVAGAAGADSCVAAQALAIRCARAGHKTLLVDAHPGPATSALGEDETFSGEEGLEWLGLDPVDTARQAWPAIRGQVRAVLDGVGLEAPALDDVLLLEAATALMRLLELREVCTASRWDIVVVDAGPVGAAVSLLGLPSQVIASIDRLLPVSRRVDRAIRAAGRPDPDPVVTGLPHIGTELRSLAELFDDGCGYLVAPPDLGAEDAVTAGLTGMWLHGLAVQALLVPGLVPDAGHPWLRETASAQRAAVRSLATIAGPAQLVTAAHPGGSASGPHAVQAIVEALDGHDPQGARPPAGPRVRRWETGFELALTLPSVRGDDLTAVRDGDDLVVCAHGHRRVVRLASALRRCIVTGASFRRGELVVRFEPDPQLWAASW
ncbi:MAG: ArsA family ATPase [Actinomycetales bacterium]